nr:retrotransposon-related protein [Tanacetum cinerariifolium]
MTHQYHDHYLPLPTATPEGCLCLLVVSQPRCGCVWFYRNSIGVEMDPKKFTVVRGWPMPKTLRQVWGFLALSWYYRYFIKGYATMDTPLTDLMRKDGFKWGVQEATAFVDVKQQLFTAPILDLLDFEQVYVVEADASTNGIGAVLL